jgi:hypothetical protein
MGAQRRRKLAGTYPNTQTNAKAIWEKTPTMTTFGNFKGETVPCTWDEWNESGNDGQVALHESSHCVGGWVCELPLRGMWLFSPDGERPAGVHAAARGVVLQQGAIGERLRLPFGERLVLAKSTAFMEISGVWGDGEAYSANPLMQDRTQLHLMDAMRLYQMLVDGTAATKIDDDTLREVSRIVPLVEEFFSDQRIRKLTEHLAKAFLRERYIDGEDINKILDTTWAELNKSEEEASLRIDPRIRELHIARYGERVA